MLLVSCEPNVDGLSFDEALLSVLLAGHVEVTDARRGCTISVSSMIGSPR